MNPEQIEEMIQHHEKVTFLLGTIIGAIGVILRNIEDNNVDEIQSYDALKELYCGSMKQVDSIFYDVKIGTKND